jgi:peptidoglycan/LPS O-acetylase OafA/YrhL
MEKAAGKNSGFDYLRLVLALLVISFHSIVLCYGKSTQKEVDGSIFGIFFGLIVPMFFALSGFLVAGSLVRSPNLGIFIGLRAFRIIPALLVDTLFSALILGPLLTTFTLYDYFNDHQLHAYFLNIIGDIHFHLPGLFINNPSDRVNGQLWTIPYELECYLVLAAMGLIGLHRKRILFAMAVLAAMSLLEIHLLIHGGGAWRNIVLCFLAGVVFYLFRDKIPLRWFYFFLAATLSCLILAIPAAGYLSAFPIAYMTIFIGLLNPKKISILETGDYSYGLYLYGYPLQQALVSTLPFAREWYGNLILGIPLAFLFAFFSWHVIEKKALSRKKILYRIFNFRSRPIAKTESP